MVMPVGGLPTLAVAMRLAGFGQGHHGTIGHMIGEIYKRRASLDIAHVPYKGTAPAVQDFIGGHVPLLYETPSAVWEHIQSAMRSRSTW